jgi:hypothetical protein
MKDNAGVEGANADAGLGMGQLIGNFPDVRAAPARIVGAFFGVPGLASSPPCLYPTGSR